jgi:hypothetical protein
MITILQSASRTILASALLSLILEFPKNWMLKEQIFGLIKEVGLAGSVAWLIGAAGSEGGAQAARESIAKMNINLFAIFTPKNRARHVPKGRESIRDNRGFWA